jgi:hypothetical protein
MNKLSVASLLAIVGIAFAQQQASAWTTTKFGIGMNWEYSSGGNSFFWGLYKNGQPPPPPYTGMPYGAPSYSGGQEYPMVPQGFTPPAPVPALPPKGVQGNVTGPAVAGYPGYYGSPYQYVNYPHPYYAYPYNWYGR